MVSTTIELKGLEYFIDNPRDTLYTILTILVKIEVKIVKLSTRGRYGTRILLELALRGGGPIPLKDVAQRQQISISYVARLVALLVAGGMIRSTRGARGGIALAKPAEEIKLSEVIQFLEGSIALVDCVNNPEICDRSEACVTRDVWGELERAMSGVLESTTLQDLVERQKTKESLQEVMYYI